MASVRIPFYGFQCFLIARLYRFLRRRDISYSLLAALCLLLLCASSLFGQTAGPPVSAQFTNGAAAAQVTLPLMPERQVAAPAPVPPGAEPGPANAEKPEETVVDVRVQGNRDVPLTKIIPQVKTRAGRPFRLDVVQEDVRRLNHTKLFVTVRTFTRHVPEGVVVVFDVLERPLLRYVKYVGNSQMTTKKLQQECGLKAGDPFDPFAVEEARRKLESFYHEKGFSRALITLLEGNRTEDQGAVFLIDEGQKQRILWTSFVGNTIASDARLRTQIDSKPGFFWLFKGEVDRKKIDEDVTKLTAYYRSLGYLQAKVGRELQFNDKENWLKLTFVIDEGLRSKIRNVTIIGNTKFTTDDLSEKLKLKANDYFNQADLQHDLVVMQDKYGAKGYIYADVKADPRILEQPGLLDLVYTVKEGDRYRVGKIYVNIQGDPSRTKLTTILNRLSLKPGDIIDTRELRSSERRLQASGLFLADMAKGEKPKISYVSPDKQTEVANENGNAAKPKYRGQSPELSAADLRPEDRYPVADITVEGTLAPASQLPAAPAVAPPMDNDQTYNGRSFRAYRAETPVETETQPLIPNEAWAYLQSPQAQPQPAQPQPASVGQASVPANMVVRYQYTSEGNGYSMPPLPPRDSWSTPSISSQPNSSQNTSAIAPMPANSYSAPPASRYTTSSVPPSPGLVTANGQPVTEDGPVFDRPGDRDWTRPVDLNIGAKETETGKLMFGVGVNSDAGLVGQIVLDERNFDIARWPTSYQDIYNGQAFRGAGQQFRLEAMPGTQLQRYSATFREPYLFDSNVSFGLTGYYFDRWYDEWQEERVGGKVSLGYQLTHDLSITGSYRGERVKINNVANLFVPDYREMLGVNALHGFGIGLSHDTRDSAFLPTEGHLIDLSFEQVVGTFQYPTVELNLRKYFTLHQRADGSGRHVLTLASSIGYKGPDTPAYDRFFAGGYSTLRGFYFRGASPKDSIFNSYVVGGDAEVLASIEYMFPITADDMLRGVVFCDTGAIQPSFGNWKDNYRVAPGFGLRITMPALGPAPIALDFAFPISTQPGDRIQNFSFFIGLGR